MLSAIARMRSNASPQLRVSGCRETIFWWWRQPAKTAVDFLLKPLAEPDGGSENPPRMAISPEAKRPSGSAEWVVPYVGSEDKNVRRILNRELSY